MGLCLFPADGEVDGPEACFSYGGFAQFRRRLALAEQIRLEEMQGFGGDRSWNDIATAFEPLLNHPDDHGRSLTPDECRAFLPRLEAVLAEWTETEPQEPELREHIADARDLIAVLQVCVQKNVELSFL
ncbi:MULTISPECIES: hypothetical protein [Streptomyces]|uniref:hypothetical protein n=1 Tax=Streptomyces TaxID=1883 RepID=UPI00163D26DD|nr:MULTISPECIES: hypothetical protein [Streptomyces]MBC2876359.1 hypothetical protein [Streptomyces sp. TYQ1024]UBI35424.1 hypothetical protein K7I03_02390 [Streptomyces mobaraensis]UKW28016.1 hypothetical protein MCU78_02420 [Streptomyces sp. TYQ1024]